MKKKIFEHLIDIPDWRPGMELLNEGLSYEESYWKPIKFPKLFYDIDENTRQFSYKTVYNAEGKLVALSQEDSVMIQKLLLRDIHRRIYGVHMKNGDEIIWIPPDYYFLLQWFQQKDIDADEEGNRLGSMRLIQNEIIQVWEWVKHNREIAGLIVPKIKKCGITYLFAAAFLNEATLTRNNDFLVMSKDYDTCKLSVFTFMEYGWDNLPWIMKPVASKKNESEIIFKRPKDKHNRFNKTERYLQNVIKACKTKPAAFDGPVPFRCWIDEFPKMWKASKVSVQETFDKSVEAIKKNQVISGKLLMTSYMPEEADRGFYEGRDICEKSLLRTIKPGNLRTESNMIILPIYGYQSNQECFDKYGRCDEERASKIVMKSRSEKVTKKDIQTHKRQYPMSWGDMFDNTGVGAAFDNVRLNIRNSELREEDAVGLRRYKEGNLRWENSMWEEGRRPLGSFCPVYFEELTPDQIAEGKTGAFRVFHDLGDYEYLKHLQNRTINEPQYDEYGKLLPNENTIGVQSIDPTDYKLASDVREGSKNGSYGGFMYDLNMDSLAKKQITDCPIFEYLYRHEDPDHVLEDMIKAIIYWGFYCIIEGNKGWMYTEFKKHGLQNFLMVRQEDGSITPWIPFADMRGGNKMINSDENMIAVYMRAIARYIAVPRKDEVDKLSLIDSMVLLTQMMDFDPMNTRRFDAAVAFGYWRVGIECLSVWLKTKDSRKPKHEFSENLLNLLLNI